MALPFAGDRLDLDDVGAQVAQALGREGAGHGDGAVEDAEALEDGGGFVHGVCWR